jgi:Fur family transcriptional regulator, ferric uptake regulator
MKRRTTQRAAIERAFLDQDHPLDVADVLRAGRRSVPSLNQATVYRNLGHLVGDGWLRRVNHPALGTLYERTERPHHHHFNCRLCGRVYELPGCALSRKAVPSGFVPERHEVFLYGRCPSCAT